MEQNPPIYRKPKYTKQWLGLHCLYVLGLALMLTLISCGIDSFASGRVESGLLNKATFSQLSESIAYCFSIIAITSVSLMLVELTFRKGISYLQYALIAMSLTLFYLLLLALSEKLPFGASFAIVSVMTVGLIVWFINGITRNPKAVGLTAGILVAEYGLMFILIKLGSTALLVGSLILFLLIAFAMYLTLKLRVEDDELIIK